MYHANKLINNESFERKHCDRLAQLQFNGLNFNEHKQVPG